MKEGGDRHRIEGTVGMSRKGRTDGRSEGRRDGWRGVGRTDGERDGVAEVA